MTTDLEKRTPRTLAIALLAALGLGLGGLAGTALAQDMTDNETCLMCHADMDLPAPADGAERKVHSGPGQFKVEAHAMNACTDCHVTITDVPHPEGVEHKTDCSACHAETPE